VTDAGEVLFGVAGWSYPDWKDVVYPRNCKDTLRAVAAKVALLEINTTFYHPPTAKNCASWAGRTQDFGTRFAAKLPQEFTHEGSRDAALIAETREGFLPLAASGRLLALLAQTNFRVEATETAIAHFALLQDAFGDLAQVVVEVRHRSWDDERVLDRLRGLGLAVANLDYPGAASGFARDVTGVNGRGDIAYFRLHGRNPAWFQKDAGRDQVYDWQYSAREVEQLGQRLLRIAPGAKTTLVVANNHFHGKAVKVIEDLLAWYRGEAG
jgi:uncharacterized protein YecE (DUF72 family)